MVILYFHSKYLGGTSSIFLERKPPKANQFPKIVFASYSQIFLEKKALESAGVTYSSVETFQAVCLHLT